MILNIVTQKTEVPVEDKISIETIYFNSLS